MKLRRRIVIATATIGFTAFAVSFVVFDRLERSSPGSPVVKVGQVYSMNSHGHLFYVTRRQYGLFRSLIYGGWSLAVVAAGMNNRWKVVHNLTPEGWQLPK